MANSGINALSGWLPPTPRIPLRELPPLPLLPEPLFRLHPVITSVVTFGWDVRLHPLPTEFSPGALALPAFDSSPSIKSFTLRFSPLPGTPTMDYSCEVKMPARAPRDSPITIGRVFRCIHRAIYAPLEPTALPQGDPVRSHVERAYRRRTAGRVDVLRNVDLHMAGQADNDGDGDGGLFFHGIVVEEVVGPYGAYPVFRVVLKDYPPFA